MEFKRNCPLCNKELNYVSKSNKVMAEKQNRPCRMCSYKERNYNGIKNPFFGMQHSVQTKNLISSKLKGRKLTLTPKTKQSLITTAKRNLVHGDVKEFWIIKYGEEETKLRVGQLKEKLRKRNSGSGNPMFGKPAPKGSGNGWSGWYKKWYFRSLKELAYMINVIEKENYNWVSAESNQFRIVYVDWKGSSRTYFADFIINSSFMIECKPKKLWNTPTVLAKKLAAESFCSVNNLVYRLVDPHPLENSQIKELHDSGKIQFLDKYETMYRSKYV